jgi:hypothetical protein
MSSILLRSNSDTVSYILQVINSDLDEPVT